MKVLIVTVAGVASRFNIELNEPVIKCLYHESKIEDSLLYQLVSLCESFDKIVIVGGYLFEHLKETIESDFQIFLNKIILVNNEYYSEYGSGYSLFLGIMAIHGLEVTELIFAEGDLFVDKLNFQNIISSPKNVITVNCEPILAKKSVVFYQDLEDKIHYLYDLNHGKLFIPEPFITIYNSAQIWKMNNIELLFQCLFELPEEQHKGTNLVLIQNYFDHLESKDYEIITMKVWFNCNTVNDYRMAVCHRKDNDL